MIAFVMADSNNLFFYRPLPGLGAGVFMFLRLLSPSISLFPSSTHIIFWA
jgi:hypothetical protein